MSNVEINLPAVDGSLYTFLDEDSSCKEIVHELWSDDFAAPPTSMRIKIRTDSGKLVEIMIPYDDKQKAAVSIDGEWI